MREIWPEGTQYFYLTLEDDLPSESELGFSLWNPVDFDKNILTNSGDIRAVIIHFPRSERGALYYLCWDDGTDLGLLDIKVIQGTFTDDDFKRAVKTVYGRTLCFNCKCVWHTLVIPTGDPYLGASGLDMIKLQQTTFKTCPHCGEKFNLGVVKIFDDAI